MIDAAIFDMDGLLFDTERLCCEAWRAVSSAAGYEMKDSLFISCVGRNERDTREIVLGAIGESFPYDEFKEQAGTWMMERMASDGPPEKPGIRELLRFLREQGVPIALATSTSERHARWMIERAQLSPYFDAYAFGCEVERGKPAPDIFLLAMKRLSRSSPDRIAVFEDSEAGLRAASSAGMRPVFVPDMVLPSDETLRLVWKHITGLDEAANSAFYESIS